MTFVPGGPSTPPPGIPAPSAERSGPRDRQLLERGRQIALQRGVTPKRPILGNGLVPSPMTARLRSDSPMARPPLFGGDDARQRELERISFETQAQLAALRSENNDLRTRLTQSEARTANTAPSAKPISDIARFLKDKEESAVISRTCLVRFLTDYESTFKKAWDDLQKHYKAQIAQLTKAHSVVSQKEDPHEDVEMAARLRGLTRELNKANELLQVQKAELESTKARHNDEVLKLTAEACELRRQLDENAQASEGITAVTTKSEDLKRFENELTAAQANIKELRQKLDSAHEKNEKLLYSNDELWSQLNSMVSQTEAANAEVEKEQKRRAEDRRHFEGELRAVEGRAKTADNTAAELRGRVSELTEGMKAQRIRRQIELDAVRGVIEATSKQTSNTLSNVCEKVDIFEKKLIRVCAAKAKLSKNSLWTRSSYSDLSKAVKVAENAREAALNELRSREGELEAEKSKCTDLEAMMEETIEESRNKEQNFTQEVAILTEQCVELEKELVAMKEAFEKIKNLKDELIREKEDIKAELEATVTHTQKNKEELIAATEAARARCEMLEKELVIKKEMIDKFKPITEELEAEKAKCADLEAMMEETIEESRNNEHKLSESVASATAHCVELEKELAETREVLQKSQAAQVDSSGIRARSAELEQLLKDSRSALTSLQEKLSATEEQLENAKKRISELEEDILKKDERIQGLKVGLDGLQTLNEQVMQDGSRAAQELSVRDARISAITDDINNYNKEISLLKETIESCNSQISVLKQNLDSREMHIANLEENISNYNKQQLAMQAKLDSGNAEISNLSKTISQSNNEISLLKDNIESREIEILSLKENLESRDAQMSVLKQNLESREVQLSRLQNEIRNCNTEILTLKESVSSRDAQISLLRENLSAGGGRGGAEGCDSAQIANLTAEVKRAKEKEKRVARQAAALWEESHQLKKEHDNVLKELQYLREDRERTECQLVLLRESAALLESKSVVSAEEFSEFVLSVMREVARMPETASRRGTEIVQAEEFEAERVSWAAHLRTLEGEIRLAVEAMQRTEAHHAQALRRAVEEGEQRCAAQRAAYDRSIDALQVKRAEENAAVEELHAIRGCVKRGAEHAARAYEELMQHSDAPRTLPFPPRGEAGGARGQLAAKCEEVLGFLLEMARQRASHHHATPPPHHDPLPDTKEKQQGENEWENWSEED